MQQPGKVSHHIVLVCTVSDVELEGLESEVPPGQRTMISLQVELPS